MRLEAENFTELRGFVVEDRNDRSASHRLNVISAMILATRKTGSANNMDLARFWRNRNRRKGGQPARYDWITGGAALIGGDGLP